VAQGARVIRIASEALSAEINPLGAELSSLRDAEGRELMTDADPAFWTGRAPLLFPIVGALRNDRYRIDGREFAMPKHGFARRRMFETVLHEAQRLVMRLTDDAATRALYPFAFALELRFVLAGPALEIDAAVTNRDERDIPVSFGFHPAFAWPLPYGRPREEHRIVFERDEPSALAQLTPECLVAQGSAPSPLQDGRTLRLKDALFAHDALIWTHVESRSVVYGAPDGPTIEVKFPDTHMLGIWTRPGAHFVCIEPWHGLADIEGADGDFWDKTGMARLKPGEHRTYSMQVTLRP
jgi:galactose mutarotase-like enzyme